MQARWYFDFISPFAYLQLPRVLALRARADLVPVPIVFGALLAHHGQLGPAEIASKRAFTYRFVQWQAGRAGIALRFPPAHPFNPLAALRLCIAAGAGWDAVERVFAHIWHDGGSGVDASELAPVALALGLADAASAIADPAVKARLRANTEAAIAAGVFGVPTIAAAGETFWGLDATPMFEDWLGDSGLFERGEYARLATLPEGTRRANGAR
ncbi:MAG: 2-hydroxychromene-2-carboxylate isomerase [Lysobacteraceae bacterium]|nr:MAG: 2-hydroxychromene-2-carboxylate isomerase [Xanthomonadaceae bacterium]